MSWGTYLAIALLKRKTLSMKDYAALTNALLDKMNVPYKDIMMIDEEGKITINNLELDFETIKSVRENAKLLLESNVRSIVREQVAFRAVAMGIHNGDTPEKIFFSRAALWSMQQEDELYQRILSW